MEENLKQLLLKDLSARLPYGVLCHINGDTNTPRKLSRIEVDELDGVLLDFWTDREDYLSIQVYLSEVKPYLRPMSSMTEKEREEVEILIFDEWFAQDSGKVDGEGWIEILANYDVSGIDPGFCSDYTDWLMAHHFDCRGLISKGLALEAPADMYNLKE